MRITDNPKFNKLKAKMLEKGVTAQDVADRLGVHVSGFYRKLKKGNGLTIGEAKLLKEILELTDEEACDIFLI